MPRLRVLVSTAYFALEGMRARLESFIHAFGYDPVFFDFDDAASAPEISVEHSCKVAAKSCSILVLLIGGRYRSTNTDESEISRKTQQDRFASAICSEYISAFNRKVPVYIFVEEPILFEYPTYKRNRTIETIDYAHVDTRNVFQLLESIALISRGDFVRPFSHLEEISKLLRDQWADLFADLIVERSENAELKDLAAQVAELRQITAALKGKSPLHVADASKAKTTEASEVTAQEPHEDRVDDFAAEKLIQYISPRIPDAAAKSPEKLYKNFADAKSFEAFLSRSGVTPESRTELLGMPSAVRNYHDIATRYFGRVSEAPTPQSSSQEAAKRSRRN